MGEGGSPKEKGRALHPKGKRESVGDVLGKEKLKVSEENPLIFEQFVTMKDNFYYAEHPFDYCLLKNGDKERVIKVVELDFYLSQKDS